MGGDAARRQAACAEVYRRFPALEGVRPTVAPAAAGERWVYTFERSVETSPGGPRLRQIVRVTVEGSGRVVKLVASR